MSGYQNVFGGSTVQPSNVSLQQLTLSASIVTFWPPYATTGQVLGRIMEVSPSAANLTISLPDATLAGGGSDVLFDNNGAYSFNVLDFSGNVLATVAPGTVWYLYLASNLTQAGSWRITQFGASTSAVQASAVAGYGLKVIGSALAQAIASAGFASNFTIQTSDRAKMYFSTGAALTVSLQTSSTYTNDFFFEVRNQGTGPLTIQPYSGETIDGVLSIVLQINESCHVHANTGAWYTVGRGRNQSFNFTQLTKTTLTGGSYSLTLSEASNVVQTYTSILTSNQTIVFPAVVQVYYVTNNLSGGYSLTLKSPVAGNTITIPYGQSAVVFCDGTNVYNASNTSSGFTALALNAGTAASPSLTLGGTNNGFYAPSSTALAAAPNGTEITRWTNGQNLTVNGTAALPAYSFTLSGTTGFYSPATNQVALAINGTEMELDQSTGKTLYGNLVFGTGVTFPANMTQAQAQTAIGAPSTAGSGASGTWGISISGNAATATTASSANALAAASVVGAGSTINGSVVGYRDVVQNVQAAGYTLVLGDAGKHIYMSSAGAFTIPANSSVAFPIGTAITFVNPSTSSTIAITSDTMYLAGLGTTGTRTLAQYGVATILKVTATTWIISGSGLT